MIYSGWDDLERYVEICKNVASCNLITIRSHLTHLPDYPSIQLTLFRPDKNIHVQEIIPHKSLIDGSFRGIVDTAFMRILPTPLEKIL